MATHVKETSTVKTSSSSNMVNRVMASSKDPTVKANSSMASSRVVDTASSVATNNPNTTNNNSNKATEVNNKATELKSTSTASLCTEERNTSNTSNPMAKKVRPSGLRVLRRVTEAC